MRLVQALLGSNGHNPEKVLRMSAAELEAHLDSIAKIRGKQSPGNSTTTRRFKGHRKNKK